MLTEGRVTERDYLKILERQNLQIKIDLAESGMAPVISNPCFELWLLLHKQDQTAHIDRRDLQKKCRELGLMDGKRIQSEAIPMLLEAIEAARRRAVALDKRHEGNGSEPNSNPSTNAWEIAHAVLQLDA